jgi:hypothetical protein
MISYYIKYIFLDQQLAWNDNDPNPNAYIGFLGMNFNTDSDTPYAFQLLDGEAQSQSLSFDLRVYRANFILQLYPTPPPI